MSRDPGRSFTSVLGTTSDTSTTTALLAVASWRTRGGRPPPSLRATRSAMLPEGHARVEPRGPSRQTYIWGGSLFMQRLSSGEGREMRTRKIKGVQKKILRFVETRQRQAELKPSSISTFRQDFSITSPCMHPACINSYDRTAILNAHIPMHAYVHPWE